MADASQNVGAGPDVAGFLSGRRWLLLLPVGAFSLVAAALGIGLLGNPREIPSALIGNTETPQILNEQILPLIIKLRQ